MATTRDVQEIISKLSSDKVKAREEGIKLLSSWLEGERAVTFCRRLARNTAKMKPDEIPHDETWPFLLTLLVKCISLEISTSKKKPPKLIFAKTFRTAIQCAEDPKLSGKDLLSSVAKFLFNHIWDVIKDVPSFQSEYSNILRNILTVKKYCYQMRKRVYCSLIMLFIDKIGLSVDMKADGQSSTFKEELFRCILTLHALLENPPGDFPANIREDVVKGFIRIFLTIREEGKVPRKLMECVNVFLSRDGPNLGNLTIKIHSAIEDFMFRFWLTTYDRGLKNSLVNYARIMLLLYRRMSEGAQLIEKLLDVITRELDQSANIGAGFLWSDMPRDDKMGTLESNQQGLMELSAIVFYQSCKNKRIWQCEDKRLKMEHAADRVRDGLVKGSWLWKCAFCFLIRKFGYRINKSLLIYWFQGTNESLKRILNNSDTLHSPDLLLWLLRAFQELSTVLHLDPSIESPHISSFSLDEVSIVRNGWQDTWTILMHGLPTFSGVTPVVEVCLRLLGDMISHDQVFGVVVPQELWDLRIFKKMPSQSALYFISCYFSRADIQGDVRDVLHLRKDLLRAILDLVDFKLQEPSSFDEHFVKFIPEALFSLCGGFGPFSPLSENIFMSEWNTDDGNKLLMADGYDQDLLDRVLECSVESIAEIEPESLAKVKASLHNSIQLPRQIKQPLIHEIKEHLTGLISSNVKTDGTNTSVLIYKCSLLCNCIYWSILTRLREDNSLVFTKIFDYIPEILDHTASIFQEKCNEIRSHSCLNTISVIESSGITMPSIRSLLSSQLFVLRKEVNDIEHRLLGRVTEATERLLIVLGELFDVFSYFTNDPDIKLQQPISNSNSEYDTFSEHKVQIVDVELDLGEGSSDVDSSTGGSKATSTSFAYLHWKSELASIISCFSSLFPARTWEILFSHIGKGNDERVSQKILLTLCKAFPSTAGSLHALANLISTMTLMIDTSKLCCFNILICVHSLLEAFKSRFSKNIVNANECNDNGLKENLNLLYNLLNKVSEIGVLDWTARVKLIDCICCIITLDPCSAQVMIERILAMLQDPDYRVRLFLAKRVSVLFHTWDGHNELFHDICSSFGFAMVMASKEKTIKAGEVLAAGPLSTLALETALITLTHIAASSDKVETEIVFMMCAVAAMEPYQRELVHALFDNLSRRLQYASRNKYLEQLIGSILAYWVACEVSLVALVEVQGLFGYKLDAKYFLQYCCPWLIPPLILREDIRSLNWISEVSGHALASLMKEYFVPIFSSCMGVYCSSRPDKEVGERALTKSILQFTNMSELDRDDLIKRHMVSIVSRLFSLASASPDPELPYFTKNTVVLSVQTVVDGFMEMDVNPSSKGIVDKINIFRPDRIFKFLVEMHFQIAASVSPRHICHRLSAIEVLIDVIGPRATVSSISYYIINIVGQFIQIPHLQDLCCSILSKLLEAFKSNCNKEGFNVLGEQLQLLVSKLVSCCIPPGLQEERVDFLSPGIISLLHELIVDADPLLYDYIRELEPFPELDCLEKIRLFHDNLCKTYSARDHFLKFVRKAFYLPKGVLLLRFQHLHKSLLSGEIIQRKSNAISDSSIRSCWVDDPDVVSAVWMLVGLCGLDNNNAISELLADFVSRIGIGDPREIVFSLPRNALKSFPFVSSNYLSFKEESPHTNSEVSDELVVILLRLLIKFLSDDSVKIVDVTSQTLKGILSTEKGHSALLSLDPYERSLIGIHSKGVNPEVVENSLLELDVRAETISLEDSSLWSTENKNFDMWVCSLVHSLIRHSDDVFLRLCQNIVSLKAEAAEVLLSSVLVNLTRKIDSDVSFCELISVKVKENIFLESNTLLRSIQVMLDSLNKLRSCYVTEKLGSSVPAKQSKGAAFGKTRSTLMKSKGHVSSVVQNSLWKKVYWLSIDYLVAAKAAIHCGLYFTAILYIEYWCEENFKGLQLGSPDLSDLESLPPHTDVLVAAFTQINEPDSIYGIIQSNKLKSQIITSEHEGNWSKALEYYDLLVRSSSIHKIDRLSGRSVSADDVLASSRVEEEMGNWKLYKGLMRSLQKTGCTHVLDAYCQGLIGQKSYLQYDPEFIDLQYEAAWRAGNWDFTLDTRTVSKSFPLEYVKSGRFNKSLHSCLRALQEGDTHEFHLNLTDAKKDLVISTSSSSRESIEYIYSTIVKLQILDHLGVAWDIRWKSYRHHGSKNTHEVTKASYDPILPTKPQLNWLNVEWSYILKLAQLHLNMYEPFIAFRHVLLRTIDCKESTLEHLLESASTLRKGSRFSLAASALHELKQLCSDQQTSSQTYFLARLEEAKLLRAQGQQDMAINLASHIAQSYSMGDNLSNVYRLVGKWLAETRSSNSSVILEKYLKHSVELSELSKGADKESACRRCQTYYHLAHYADSLFKSYEERLASSEWQAAMRLKKHKARELDALVKRLRSSSKGDKTDYATKIHELQKQLKMDSEEAEKLLVDRDNFLNLALEGYQRSLTIGGKYDLRVVFRLVSLWFNYFSAQNVVTAMMTTVKEIQSYKFIPLVYQIASRLGSAKDGHGSTTFQTALLSLVRKMAIDHPYHTIFQLLALANGDRVKDKQRSRNSFIVDMDKKMAAENLLNELARYHGALIRQMKQLVEVYIKLAELETRKEETNKRVPLPRDIRSLRQLELVPVITATIPVDPTCQYREGSFPHFKGLEDSIMIMNGINAPKVVECYGSDGHKYRQLAKSGNDDLRQDAVMEQFFGLVNSFLENHRDTWKRRLRIRTYKVVPFTPSAGVLEWVDRTLPLGEYLLGSTRNGGAHGRYGNGDWSFLQCREYMINEKDKRKAFNKVCDNFRPVMHFFFLERFLQPADWFKNRLSYTRSVAASSMVGYIVGLGDRHSMNILIDQETAEVVHIDLGVAFEQGLMLKTPERVPFRLTRDIIDGMGITGVEGVFRKCCEETLSVMRTNKEALLTIIEVFIHDPLYKWALSPLKALQRQKETDDDIDSSLENSQDACEGNMDAARATLRVKQKLDGYEMGEMRSVQGQVQQLIQDAVDIDRLCHMFPGWGAWL